MPLPSIEKWFIVKSPLNPPRAGISTQKHADNVAKEIRNIKQSGDKVYMVEVPEGDADGIRSFIYHGDNSITKQTKVRTAYTTFQVTNVTRDLHGLTVSPLLMNGYSYDIYHRVSDMDGGTY